MKIRDVDVVVPGPLASSMDDAKQWFKDLTEEIEPASMPGSIVINGENGDEFNLDKIVKITDAQFYGKMILAIRGEPIQFIPVTNAIGTLVTSDVDDEDEVSEALQAIADLPEDEAGRAKAVEELVPLLTDNGKVYVGQFADDEGHALQSAAQLVRDTYNPPEPEPEPKSE